MKKGTQFIHAGVEPDPTTGAVMTPIYQTSTYVQEAPGDHKGYEYSRTDNPTRHALELALATAENATAATVWGSGMAAVDVLVRLLAPGDEVVVTNDLYGGTHRLFTQVYQKWGLHFKFVDVTDPAKVEAAFSAKTKMLWLETPTNPLLNIADIRALASLAKAKGAVTVVDNTFATPYLQNPLDLGADIVMHSMTKYIGGHSDLVMGCICVKDNDLQTRLKFLQNAAGAVPGPMDSFLALRGLKTLHLRMRAHSANAMQVAEYLAQHPKVGGVYYPGLPNHKGHEIAKAQMKDFGGMVSFYTKTDKVDDAVKVMQNTLLFLLAESLGGVESLIGHPATMTHAAIPVAQRHAAGLRDSLIRLSVGIEDVEDLIADLDQALASV